MVAIKKYDRIEASGIWRASADAQRVDVIVSLGDATLTIKTVHDHVLAHWSLAAIHRQNPGVRPAKFHPDGDPDETLELSESEPEMIEAIETLRKAVTRARPHPGRLRWLGFLVSSAAVVALAFLWVPGALRDHTLNVVPQVGRAQIGQDLLARIQRVTGPNCGTTETHSGLARFGARLDATKLVVIRGGLDTTLHVPGGRILIPRQILEDHEDPDVAAGFVLAERSFAHSRDPLSDLLETASVMSTFRLLTTGRLDDKALDAYAEHILTRGAPSVSDAQLVSNFAAAQVRSSPYAFARDITGETVLTLIEADPMRGKVPAPLISDADWIRLQAICE